MFGRSQLPSVSVFLARGVILFIVSSSSGSSGRVLAARRVILFIVFSPASSVRVSLKTRWFARRTLRDLLGRTDLFSSPISLVGKIFSLSWKVTELLV